MSTVLICRQLCFYLSLTYRKSCFNIFQQTFIFSLLLLMVGWIKTYLNTRKKENIMLISCHRKWDDNEKLGIDVCRCLSLLFAFQFFCICRFETHWAMLAAIYLHSNSLPLELNSFSCDLFLSWLMVSIIRLICVIWCSWIPCLKYIYDNYHSKYFWTVFSPLKELILLFLVFW